MLTGLKNAKALWLKEW